MLRYFSAVIRMERPAFEGLEEKNTGGVEKCVKCTHTEAMLSVCYLSTDGNHAKHLPELQTSNVACVPLLLSVSIERYDFNAVVSFFKMRAHFLGTLCILYLRRCS